MLQKLLRRGIDIDGLVVRELFVQVQTYGSFNVGRDSLHQGGSLSCRFCRPSEDHFIKNPTIQKIKNTQIFGRRRISLHSP